MSFNKYQKCLTQSLLTWMALSFHMLVIYWFYFSGRGLQQISMVNTDDSQLSIDFSSTAARAVNSVSTATSFDRPPFPSLVIVGPPKCGTTTLTMSIGDMNDFIANPIYHSENHFWNGWDGAPKCYPDWSHARWLQLFEQWRSSSNSNSSFSFVHTMHAAITGMGAQCHVQTYLSTIERSCKEYNVTECNSGRYYFVEAAQSYHRNPFVTIPYGLYLKETKLLQSIRDPINMIWSFTWHFCKTFFPAQQFATARERTDAMETFIIDRFTKNYPDGYADDFTELSSFCTKIRHNRSDRELRREMMITLLKIKFIRKVAEPKLRQDGFVWIANYLSGVLFYLHILDEIHGTTQWDQYKVIQFEWFYENHANTGQGLAQIRDWVVQPEKYPHAVAGDFDLEQYTSPQMKDEKKLKKNMHMSNGTYSPQFRNKLMPLFSDCNHALQDIILLERPHLLIGGWNDWGY